MSRRWYLVFAVCVVAAGLAAAAQRAAPTTVAHGQISRTSKTEDAHGRFKPPWSKVEVANIFSFRKRPKVGDKVTVVPLVAGMKPLTLTVTKTRKRGTCGEGAPFWYEVDLSLVMDPAYFSARPSGDRHGEYPFDVAVLHPAVPGASYVPPRGLDRASLPRSVAPGTVRGAIDLGGDARPDAIYSQFCCQAPGRSTGCEYFCTETWLRGQKGWRRIDKSRPC